LKRVLYSNSDIFFDAADARVCIYAS